jgi:hypothetical protein
MISRKEYLEYLETTTFWHRLFYASDGMTSSRFLAVIVLGVLPGLLLFYTFDKICIYFLRKWLKKEIKK